MGRTAARGGRRRRPLSAVLALTAALVLAAPAAHGDARQVAEAAALVEQGQLTAALTAFERALASGGNGVAELRIIYRQLGLLRAGTGDATGAQEAFEMLLSIEPDATLPEGSSPVVLEPFERARLAPTSTGEAPVVGRAAGTPSTAAAPRPARRAPPEATAIAPTPGADEPRRRRDRSVLSSPWFWGGAVAAAVGTLVLVVVVSSGTDGIYVANRGVEYR